jgi:hypothetical protein
MSFNFIYYFNILIIMNKTVILFGFVALSAVCAFLLLKSYKNERKHLIEISNLNNRINSLSKSDDTSNYNKLKEEYARYTPPETTDVSSELKVEIDTLVQNNSNSQDRVVDEPLFIGEPRENNEEHQQHQQEHQEHQHQQEHQEQQEHQQEQQEHQEHQHQQEHQEQQEHQQEQQEQQEQQQEQQEHQEQQDQQEQQEYQHYQEQFVQEELQEQEEEFVQEEPQQLVLEELTSHSLNEVHMEELDEDELVNDNECVSTNNSLSSPVPLPLEQESSLAPLGQEFAPYEVSEKYESINMNNLENMTLKELQNYARENNIKIKGKKTELIDRIKGFSL